MKTKSILLIIFLAILLGGTMLNAQTATAPSGSGTEADPYKIATLDNLYWLSQQVAADVLDKYYVQTADINAADTKNWDGGSGFSPIKDFKGKYDGQNHKIDSLYIKRGAYVGMFYIISSADVLIKNLGLTNVDLTGTDFVGALAGKLYSATVTDCYSSGKVESEPDVGGLIGAVRGAIIERCYSSAEVKGTTHKVGGLIGFVRSGALTKIKNCYSSGNISNTYAGSGEAATGGLIGALSNGTIENCYSRAVVSVPNSTSLVGGLIGGLIDAATVDLVQNSFWDEDVSGQTASAAGIGKTIVEMTDYATYTNTETVGLTEAWDFVTNPFNDSSNEDIWDMDQNGSHYPILSWQPEADDTLGNSVGVDDFQIPQKFALEQNYPNPFNPTTVISFALPKQADVKLAVYNILGEKVTELINGNMVAGYHKVSFDASNIATGIYIYRITAGNFVSVKKMMLIK